MHRTFVVLLCVAAPAQAWAQDDFSRLALKPGQTIFVTDTGSGAVVSGVPTQVSATELTVDGRRFTPGPALTIARKGDRLWNGVAIGFAAGVASGLTIGGEACASSSKWNCAIGGGVTLAALGALIDWLHSGRTTIYDGRKAGGTARRWTVVPSVSSHTRSVAVVIGSAR